MPPKKRKGPTPAHQNSFAFRHNPRSKTTAAILALPNRHTCRRCHEKVEWRKKYRKYKPRTVLGKCNICRRQNIRAAYHTICTNCTLESEKAKKLLEEWKKEKEKHVRVCAICVQEPALPDEDDDNNNDGQETTTGGRKLRLRELKTLERQRLKQEEKPKKASTVDPSGNESNDEDSVYSSEDEFLRAVGGSDQLLTGEAHQQKLLETQTADLRL